MSTTRERAHFWHGVGFGLLMAAGAILWLVICEGRLSAIPNIGENLLRLYAAWALAAASFAFAALGSEKGKRP